MDYKLIIFLILILLAIMFMYKEMVSLKQFINKSFVSYDKIASIKGEQLNNNIQQSVAQYINKIKTISSDNIDQLKKIHILNRQHINKVTNHFTETENMYNSDDEQAEIAYLSDMNKVHDIHDKKMNMQHNELYMSSDLSAKKSHDSNRSQHKMIQEHIENDIATIINTINNGFNMEPLFVVEAISELSPVPNNNNVVIMNDNDYSINTDPKKSDSVDNKSNKSDKSNQPQSPHDTNEKENHENIKECEIIVEDEPVIEVLDNENNEVDNKELELKDVDEYNLNNLKDIAKEYGVPLMYKNDQHVWKPHNKVELYNNIKNHLKENKTKED